MKRKTLIGLVLIAVFTVAVYVNFTKEMVGYKNFAQIEREGSVAQVAGVWVKDQGKTYDREHNVFSFYMQDEAGAVRQVRYANPEPASFEDAEKVVVKGRLEGEVFVAEHILLKCPSKYNDERSLEKVQSEGG